jgi:hypothetical protein
MNWVSDLRSRNSRTKKSWSRGSRHGLNQTWIIQLFVAKKIKEMSNALKSIWHEGILHWWFNPVCKQPRSGCKENQLPEDPVDETFAWFKTLSLEGTARQVVQIQKWSTRSNKIQIYWNDRVYVMVLLYMSHCQSNFSILSCFVWKERTWLSGLSPANCYSICPVSMTFGLFEKTAQNQLAERLLEASQLWIRV